MNVNEKTLKKIIAGLGIACLLLILTVILTVSLINNKNKEISDIRKHQDVDYERIESIMNSTIESKLNEQVDNGEPVDYVRIEMIVDEKLKEFNRNFGESFEDATSYFGGKIKETYDDISEQFKGK